MNPLFLASTLIGALFVFAGGAHGAEPKRTEVRVYSDKAFSEESGDVVGTEIEFAISTDGIAKGAARFWEGGLDPITTKLIGRVTGNEVLMWGRFPWAEADPDRCQGFLITGTASAMSFTGKQIFLCGPIDEAVPPRVESLRLRVKKRE